MIVVFVLTWCTFAQQMGRPVLKLIAMLLHTEKVNNLAMLYCHLETERFPTIRRRRFLDGTVKSAEHACVYPSDSQVSVVQSECCITLIRVKTRVMQAERGHWGACCASVGLGLGWAQL